jgi:DNA polymerase-3 subunit epsilon
MEVSELIVEAQKMNASLVLYNAPYDLNVIRNELRRLNLPTLEQSLGKELTVVDPLLLDRIIYPNRKGSRKLQDQLERFNILYEGRLHDSTTDAVTTLLLLNSYLKNNEDLIPEFDGDGFMEFQREGIQKVIKNSQKPYRNSYENWPY